MAWEGVARVGVGAEEASTERVAAVAVVQGVVTAMALTVAAAMEV